MGEIKVRKAKREDCKAIRELIQELADFEKMSDGPKIDYTRLEQDGFGTDKPLFESFVAEYNEAVIGHALYYYTYSTWEGKAMYMEDLYVKPEYRKKGVGTSLLKAVAKEAVNNNCCRLEFTVLNWNPAQEFYKTLGAVDMTEKEGLHRYRLSKVQLMDLNSS